MLFILIPYSNALFSYESSSKKIYSSQKIENNIANNGKLDYKILRIKFKNLKKIIIYNNQELIKYKSQVSQAKASLKSKTEEEISKLTGGLGIPGFKWPI